MFELSRERAKLNGELYMSGARDHARMRALGQRFEVQQVNLPAPWQVYDLLLHRPAAGLFYTRGDAEAARRIWEVDSRALYREESESRRRFWRAHRG